MPSHISPSAMEAIEAAARKQLSEVANPGAHLGIALCKLTSACAIGTRKEGDRTFVHCSTCDGERAQDEFHLSAN